MIKHTRRSFILFAAVAFCGSLTLPFAHAEAPAQITFSLTDVERENLTWAVAQANATAQKANEQAQASKPEKERAAFVPISEEAYLRARVAQILTSYGEQRIAELGKENAELIRKVLSLPPEVRDALKAQAEKVTK